MIGWFTLISALSGVGSRASEIAYPAVIWMDGHVGLSNGTRTLTLICSTLKELHHVPTGRRALLLSVTVVPLSCRDHPVFSY
jgi:hypothetical protein